MFRVSGFILLLLNFHVVNGFRLSQRITQNKLKSVMHDSIPPLKTEKPMRVLLCVEPTPFNYVSGYANRFKETLKQLQVAGDEVEIITADQSHNPPSKYLNYTIHTLTGIQYPSYKEVQLTLDLRGKLNEIIQKFKPTLIHVSTPSLIMFPGKFIHIIHYVLIRITIFFSCVLVKNTQYSISFLLSYSRY